jgi:serine/threonine protein phosphatase PrpC
MTELRPRAYVWSDIGRKRERNEDAYLMMSECNVYAVADGMGGHVGGQRASHVAIEAIRELVGQYESFTHGEKASTLLSDALRLGSKRIHQESLEDSALRGMGTTTTALLIDGSKALIAHVGDSRAYLIRDGKIQQISEDHSLVHEQYKAGLISFEQTKSSKFRNIITRCLGFDDDVNVDLSPIEVKSGDVIILCTDGLTTMLEDAEIQDILTSNDENIAGQKLVELANERGGFDNITVLNVYV